MHRLFVAIRPPRTMRERLLSVMGGVPGARWQSDDQLHLTLRFIGEVDRHRAEDAAAALGTIRHPRISLALHGTGQFERRGRVVTLWAGVTPHPPLAALHKKIDQALIRTGLPPEGRAYFPHITLARFSSRSAPIARAGPADNAFSDAPEEIREYYLFESTLGSEGASYSVVDRYRLD